MTRKPKPAAPRLPFDPLAPTGAHPARAAGGGTAAPRAGRGKRQAPAAAAPPAPLTVPPMGRRVTRTADLAPALPVGGRRPAVDLAGVAPVRLTVYLAPEQWLRLRQVVAERLATGVRSDVSQLVREAVDAYMPPAAEAEAAPPRPARKRPAKGRR